MVHVSHRPIEGGERPLGAHLRPVWFGLSCHVDIWRRKWKWCDTVAAYNAQKIIWIIRQAAAQEPRCKICFSKLLVLCCYLPLWFKIGYLLVLNSWSEHLTLHFKRKHETVNGSDTRLLSVSKLQVMSDARNYRIFFWGDEEWKVRLEEECRWQTPIPLNHFSGTSDRLHSACLLNLTSWGNLADIFFHLREVDLDVGILSNISLHGAESFEVMPCRFKEVLYNNVREASFISDF